MSKQHVRSKPPRSFRDRFSLGGVARPLPNYAGPYSVGLLIHSSNFFWTSFPVPKVPSNKC